MFASHVLVIIWGHLLFTYSRMFFPFFCKLLILFCWEHNKMRIWHRTRLYPPSWNQAFVLTLTTVPLYTDSSNCGCHSACRTIFLFCGLCRSPRFCMAHGTFLILSTANNSMLGWDLPSLYGVHYVDKTILLTCPPQLFQWLMLLLKHILNSSVNLTLLAKDAINTTTLEHQNRKHAQQINLI